MDLACGESVRQGPFSNKRVEMFRTGGRPGLGAGTAGIQGAGPCSGCLAEIMTGFEMGQKTKNRVITARFWWSGLSSSGQSQHQANCWSMKAVSCDLLMAPTLVAASWPSLKIIRVGMPRMPNLAGMSRLSSTFILVICNLPS